MLSFFMKNARDFSRAFYGFMRFGKLSESSIAPFYLVKNSSAAALYRAKAFSRSISVPVFPAAICLYA